MVTYKIELEHDNKGVAFTAKNALLAEISRLSRSPNPSPMTAVTLADKSSDRSELIVEMVDHNPIYMKRVLQSSGKMPTDSTLWKISSIEQVLGDSLVVVNADGKVEAEELGRTLRRYAHENERLTKEYATAGEEIARLTRRLQEASVRKMSSPLEGLLAYFDGVSVVPSIIVDEKLDLEFARRALSKEIGNDFTSYFNYVKGHKLSADEIAAAAQYNHQESLHGLSHLSEQVNVATQELIYLELLKEKRASVPESLRAGLISTIEGKNHPETISKYEAAKDDLATKKELHDSVIREKKRFDSFKDQLEVLDQASEPLHVILDATVSERLDIYFPFPAFKVNQGFVSSLVG